MVPAAMSASAAPGPPILGRGVVILPGASVPEAWAAAPVVEVGADALEASSGVVDRLQVAWGARRPVVIVLGLDPAAVRQPPSRPAEPWTLGAGFEFVEDRLQFLLWANNYDARGGAPVWWWARKALRLGAQPTPEGAPGDVVVDGGTRVWIDGGPRGPLDAAALGGLGVVHRESVERGSLAPARPEAELSPPGVVPQAPVAAGLAGLAPDQRAAVAHGSGPARIIAPAGSGKTRVLTERLRHLIVGRGWEREVTLAVAYNKRAQEELQARCSFAPRTRTLNSLGLAIVNDAREGGVRVLEERDARRLVERLAPVRRRRANTDPIGPYLEALGRVRLGLVDPAVVEEERDDVPGLAELFPRYRAELRAAGAVDFDDQVYGAIEALVADGQLRARHQASCRHLLVDEFQDLTPAHLLMLRLVAAPGLDVFGVGDDDQVIYGHAGADPGFLIDFDRYFPGAASHPLEVNYRCPPDVVTAAATLLSYNRRRVPKTIRAAGAEPAAGGGVDSAGDGGSAGGDGGSDGGDGPGLQVRLAAGASAIDALVEQVRRWVGGPGGPRAVAVLTRVNALLLAPQVALAAAGVPVASPLRPDVLERTGLRAALAYLRIATAPADGIDPHDVVEVLRRPSRGLPQWFPDRLRRRRQWSLAALGAIAEAVPDKEAPKVTALVADLEVIRAAAGAPGATTAAVLGVIRDEIGLAGAMSLLDASRGGEGSSHLDDLEALAQVAALHPDPAGFERWLRQMLSRDPEAGVTLATVHRVKGMEWDRVVVWGANAGILPHRLAEDPEEERRVLHVAITRCRRQVVVMADAGRPSPFLAELDGSAPKPAIADHLAAQSYGIGPSGRDVGSDRSVGLGGGRGARPAEPLADRSTLPAAQQAAETALRAWRLERARSDKVPPYIILSDKTLRGIVTAAPGSLVALRHVPGIGPAKLERYGDEILEVLSVAGAASDPAR